MKKCRRVLSALCAVALVGTTLNSQPAAEASAANGCLPTNGLMNLNNADDLLAGTVRLSSSVSVQIGATAVDWGHTELNPQMARLLYSLKWVEELVREHRRSGDQRYLDRAVQLVVDFVEDNPVGGGPDPEDAWYPMFAGQRATTIACVAAVSDDPALDSALRSHGAWLAGEVDALPAWNQAIDPHLGLLMAGCSLDVTQWKNQARSGFARLIVGMIEPDGVLNEQAPGYGRLVWDRWGAIADELANCGLSAPQEIPDRRAALLEWMAWLSAPDGTLTQIGDTFKTVIPPTPAGASTVYTTSGGADGTAPTDTIRVFDGGYVAGRDTWSDLPSSTYWTLRFGPGRDLHGDEDHTSVTFWVDGREVLIDSGHGGYADVDYRLALQGPDAHNVLVLPDIEFRIRRTTELLRSDSGDGWRFDEVSDDAFAKQEGRVSVMPRTRGVLVLPDDGIMVVQDQASRKVEGPFDQLWHLVAGAEILSTSRAGVVARHPAGDVDIHVLQVPLPGQSLPRGSTSVVEGQTDPTLGWYSATDGERETAPVVRMRQVGTTARMVTVVATTPVGGALTATSRVTDAGWVIDVNNDGDAHVVGIGTDGAMQLGEPELDEPLLKLARRCSVIGEPGLITPASATNGC